MKRAIVLLTALGAAMASPAAAQDGTPSVSLRPFFVVTGQRFTASQTFDTIFSQPVQPFWGGGLQVAFGNGLFFDVAASRFQRTGERAFFFEGEGFGLGIPLKVTTTPVEVTVGYRAGAQTRRALPYFGGGIGSYAYTERGDDAAEPGDAFERRHLGYLALGGVEFRAGRSVGLATDVQYTHVPGIIGTGGVSQETGDEDLGGIAVRFRVIIGR